jgi:serine/threonine-protein kinase
VTSDPKNPGGGGGGGGDGDGDDPLVGTLVDRRYRVISRLGDGGMGIVYKVEHTFLNKLFALKVMRPTRDAVDRARFEQEAQLASKIRHKNVTEISDFGVLPTGQPYFVMEYLLGHTLGDAIYDGRIDPLLACHIAAQIASGLQAVHKQNVVHRDLKPDNIFLIDPDEQLPDPAEAQESGDYAIHFVKIMDFGIAKSVDKNLTGTGMTLGTPEYMSPEQATGEKIDWRSDQYSLGCMLYEMLTGELPFIGKGAFEIMNKHLNEQPIPPRQRRPECAQMIPPALEKLVLTMIQKKPAQRFPSMRAVEQGLRDVVATMQKSAPPPASLAKTVVVSPFKTEPSGPPPFMPEGPKGAPPQSIVDTLRNDKKKAAASDAETRPILQAIRPTPEAKTLVMDAAREPLEGSSPSLAMSGGSDEPAGAAAGQPGRTPTPRLIDKLAVRVRPVSAPELPPPVLWERFSVLRWLITRLRRLFPSLFRSDGRSDTL